eukprot:9777284-Alexandrium_andersonii.AAC.1
MWSESYWRLDFDAQPQGSRSGTFLRWVPSWVGPRSSGGQPPSKGARKGCALRRASSSAS